MDLLEAPREAVHDAPQRFPECPQRLDHLRERLAGVQDQRQVEAPRDFEVGLQQAHLPFMVPPVRGAVEPAFADRGGGVLAQPLVEPAGIALRVLGKEARVQAVRGVQARVSGAKVAELRPACRRHGGNEAALDPGIARAPEDLRPIAIEFCCVQMRVAVEYRVNSFRHVRESRAEWKMNRKRGVDAPFIVRLFESNRQEPLPGDTMTRKTRLTSMLPIPLAVALAVAGCGGQGNPQAQATPANIATSAATAELPPGEQPGAADAAAQPEFAQVVAVQPITQSTTTSKPRQVCRDEQVAVPEQYKDKHQVGGAVVGGVVGALAGHQVGGGKGKTLATLGGAAAGAYAGHEIQKRHQEKNQTKTVTQNVCHTVTDKSTTTKTVGYDVTYSLNGQTGHIRMDHNPRVGTGLPVRNGQVVADGQGGSSSQ